MTTRRRTWFIDSFDEHSLGRRSPDLLVMGDDQREVDGGDTVPAAASVRTRSYFERHGLATADVLIVALAACFVIAIGPAFLVPSWTPRVILVAAVLPSALWSLGRSSWRGDVSARAASLLIGWAALSGLAANNSAMSIVGSLGRESSCVVLAASLGSWSLARDLSVAGRRLLCRVLLACFALSATIGIIQIALAIEHGSLSTILGRATGLSTHPVYFGAAMAGGIALIAAERSSAGRAIEVSLIGLFACGLGLSGSRIAVASALLVLGWCAATRGGVRLVAERFLAFVVGSVAAIVVGSLSPPISTTGDDGAGALTRVAATDSAILTRVRLWRLGVEAAFDRPVLGYGLGNFRNATRGLYSLDFTVHEALDDSSPWFDAHNVVVELLVAIGVVGLALAAVFAVLVARRARGRFAVAASAIAITWLFEPAALATLPLVMIMLGAASTPVPERKAAGRSHQAIAVTSLAVGLLLAVGVAAADLRLKSAVDEFDPVRGEAAAAWFWRDPVAADLVAQLWQFRSLADRSVEPSVHAWSERAVEDEPDNPRWWEKSAMRQFVYGHDDLARDALERSLELQPWRSTTWTLLLDLAERTDDAQLRDRAMTAVCRLELDRCDRAD